MIKEKIGDLISLAKNNEFDVILQGCNCHHSMNSGIAKQIKFQIPEAFAVDLETAHGDKSKLGTISYTKQSPFIVVNCYTQFDSGLNGVYADYNAIEKSFIEVKNTFPGKRIGMPKIGAGLAKGDWNIIKQIIEKVFCDPSDDVTVVIWDQNIKTASNNHNHKIPSAKHLITTNMTNPHKLHGKRNCIYCHNRKPIREMINYVPKVWCCQVDCHDKFFNIVASYNTAPAALTPAPTLVTAISN